MGLEGFVLEAFPATPVVVCAAGRGKRWSGPGPKTMAPFNGEPNLVRTVRLIQGRGLDYRVSIPMIDHPEYRQLYGDMLKDDGGYWKCIMGASNHEAERFWNFHAHMGYGTCVIYGDVRYTEEDLDKLLNAEPGSFLLRLGPNKLTGKLWGEVFGFKCDHEIIARICKLPPEGKAWDILGCRKPDRIVNGRGQLVYSYKPDPRFPLIPASDLTDDYDTWEEYLTLEKAWDAAEAR